MQIDPAGNAPTMFDIKKARLDMHKGPLLGLALATGLGLGAPWVGAQVGVLLAALAVVCLLYAFIQHSVDSIKEPFNPVPASYTAHANDLAHSSQVIARYMAQVQQQGRPLTYAEYRALHAVSRCENDSINRLAHAAR